MQITKCMVFLISGMILSSSMLFAAEQVVAPAHADSGLAWYDASDIGVEGKGWQDTEKYYDRLPARAKGVVRDPVWYLSHDAAGLCIRFATDAPSVAVSWDGCSDGEGGMPHMAATGNSGVDLYVKRHGKWKFVKVAFPQEEWTVRTLVEDWEPERREYLMYLSLYDPVQKLEIGIPAGSQLWRVPKPKGKPVLFYGTSITQGGCASRPGMVHTAILGRWLDREIINLGFSGNGMMEPEMAGFVGELDPAVLLISHDNVGNKVGELLEPFVEIFRRKHPDLPILLMESHLPFHAEANRILTDAWRRMMNAGDENIYLIKATKDCFLEGEATVDGVHPTDLGFLLRAEWLKGPLGMMLKR
jgi:N-terminus of Esterase_SGNH_hydro-type/GDSL-like Lipase/Acylhydrolase family